MDERIVYTLSPFSDEILIEADGHLFKITLGQLRAITEATPAVREQLRAKWAAEADNTPTREATP